MYNMISGQHPSHLGDGNPSLFSLIYDSILIKSVKGKGKVLDMLMFNLFLFIFCVFSKELVPEIWGVWLAGLPAVAYLVLGEGFFCYRDYLTGSRN